jgi:hypothetical protein
MPLFLFVTGGKRFHLRGIEKEAMTRLAHETQVAAGIVIEHNANVALAFIILLNAFDGRKLPLQR